MYYEKLEVIDEEYSGESYYRELSKENGTAWYDTENLRYELITRTGRVAATDSLSFNNIRTIAYLQIPSEATANISGPYLILVYLNNFIDNRINDVVAEYKIEYSKREACTATGTC